MADTDALALALERLLTNLERLLTNLERLLTIPAEARWPGASGYVHMGQRFTAIKSARRVKKV